MEVKNLKIKNPYEKFLVDSAVAEQGVPAQHLEGYTRGDQDGHIVFSDRWNEASDPKDTGVPRVVQDVKVRPQAVVIVLGNRTERRRGSPPFSCQHKNLHGKQLIFLQVQVDKEMHPMYN